MGKSFVKGILSLSISLLLACLVLSCEREDDNSPVTFEDGPLYNVRYCEVLTVRLDTGGQIEAEVYNSLGCNNCPQEEWSMLDYESIATEYGAIMAVPNGPRYWVMDSIESTGPVTSCNNTFGGIEMSQVATAMISSNGTANVPYAPNQITRNTIYYFQAGREVYTLQSPAGECYIMQSYTQGIDSTLQLSDLPDLGRRLALPDGWRFAAVELSEDLNLISPNGNAEVIADDLGNAYQNLHDGCL